MENSKSRKISALLFLLLLLIGIVVWGTFTGIDRKELKKSLNETTSFAKIKLKQYENFTANDRVKSLIRLLDKTKELSSNLKEIDSYGQRELDNYMTEQRLSGVIVFDENMHITLQSMKDTKMQYLWKDSIQKSYIKEILEHPEETYTERIEGKNTAYDLAVVARQDTKGLILSFVEKSDKTSGDITLRSVFENFPISMDGAITVCLNDNVVSTNKTNMLGKSVKELQTYYKSNLDENKNGIIQIRPDNRSWYGTRDKIGEYVIYVFFPASQVFMTRSIVCGVYVAIAVLIYLLLQLARSDVEKTALKQSQKRMRIINALGTAYSSIILFDLTANKAEVIKRPKEDDTVYEGNLLSKGRQKEHIKDFIAEEYQEEFLHFVDANTVRERLEGHPSLTCTFQMTKGRWMSSLIIPQRFDNEGNITAVLLANRDVTKEKEKEAEQENVLRSALAVAEHANKAKTNFLNSISHDIRTPMNAVIGFTALATTHIDNKEVVLDYLKKINVSSRHLLSLINDVLDMSRIESGKVKLEEVKVHLPDVFHDLRSIIQGNIRAKQQELYIDTQNVVHEDIITDKLRLNQVLLNVVSNAIKFTPVGGMINVRVSENPCKRQDYASYSFSIKDNGIGMSKEFQEHIFDAFTRENTVTKSGIQGTGLGMAISKNIINMMGGTITVNSEVGKGSEFIITIECRLSKDVVKYKPVPELQGARALVVDDDANTCMSVCKMLRDIEMVADWTTSGKEAVLRAKEAWDMKKEFKAYIIDWQMPDMNGIETVRRIRKIIGKDTPIIILTAYDWADIAEEAKEAGVTAFVSKPLFMSELRTALTQQVEESEAADTETAQEKRRYAGKKVLLVEDNELNREIATAILEEAGFIVEFVEDGTDAVVRMSAASESEYDLILMDVQMPKMDGYTATREIRTLSNNKKANIPIIAMTANAFEEDKQKAFEAGMNAHISKPINIEMILHTLDDVFGNN